MTIGEIIGTISVLISIGGFIVLMLKGARENIRTKAFVELRVADLQTSIKEETDRREKDRVEIMLAITSEKLERAQAIDRLVDKKLDKEWCALVHKDSDKSISQVREELQKYIEKSDVKFEKIDAKIDKVGEKMDKILEKILSS